MKVINSVLAFLSLQSTAHAFAGLKAPQQASSTSLNAWWDTGAGASAKPTSSQWQGPPLSSGGMRQIPSTLWKNISPPLRVEGQSRKTFDFVDVNQAEIQLSLGSNMGRPVKSEIQLWIGPDWTPFTLKAYTEDGLLRPIQTVLGTRNKESTVEVRNVAPYEFALDAQAKYADRPISQLRDEIPQSTEGIYVEGGAVKQIFCASGTEAVQVLLNTDTRQLNAQIEFLNGPNNPKQIFEVFTNNGLLNSVLVVFECPYGAGNSVRIRNLASLEFPCNAYVMAA